MEHFPGNELIDEVDIRSSYEGDPRPINSLEWINVHRIQKAIVQFSLYKAAGPDGIKPIVLQHLPLKAYKFLERLYTACIEMGFTPNKWCHSVSPLTNGVILQFSLCPSLGKSHTGYLGHLGL